MKQLFFFSILLVSFLSVNAQNFEKWQAAGHKALDNHNYNLAIQYFQKILSEQPDNVKILQAMGTAYMYSDRLDQAIAVYQKALKIAPDNIPVYFDLAKAYSWNDRLNEAIATYQKILQIDNTYSEAYQGIGKMYYWMEKPYTALAYYEKAIRLDPYEKPIKDEYNSIKKQTLYQVSATSKLINEQEQFYDINALSEALSVSKRINDYIDISLNGIFDKANRVYADERNDTLRLYYATWTKIGLLMNNHKFYVYGGYSFSDQKFSTYGFNYQLQTNLKSIKIKNSFTARYDYFYYWNYVGKTALQDELTVSYKKWKWKAGGEFGIVDKAFLLDVPNDKYYEGENPFEGYHTSLSYQILSQPKLFLSANYSYLNYDKKSNRYYSPLGRSLIGTSLMMYYPLGHFYIYSDASVNLGSEYYYESVDGNLNKIYLNADNWSVNAEAGYNYKQFDFSISAGRFYNNYYQNFVLALAMKYRF